MWSQGALYLLVLICGGGFVAMAANPAPELPSPSKALERDVRSFEARGVIKELGIDSRTVLVQHEAVAGYMPAMTMPFKVLDSNELAGLGAGDRISFRLRVTDTESWIDAITRIGSIQVSEQIRSVEPARIQRQNSRPRHPLLAFNFTNELGQAVALGDFRGQALAITFFSRGVRFLITVLACRRIFRKLRKNYAPFPVVRLIGTSCRFLLIRNLTARRYLKPTESSIITIQRIGAF